MMRVCGKERWVVVGGDVAVVGGALHRATLCRLRLVEREEFVDS
jgi:hypothetical protein